jgi:hypothetical protein
MIRPELASRTTIVGTILILFSTLAIADANDGDYLGYRLGEKFAVPKGVSGRDHIMGAQIFDLHPGSHPHHVDTISIFASPTSSIIGSVFGEWYFASNRAAQQFADRYLTQLATKYPDWNRSGRSLTNDEYQLWVDIEQKPPIIDHWPSAKKFRVAIGLIYAPDTLARNEWMAIIYMEINNLELAARQ